MTLAIETEDLGKRYGDVQAVEHLSLQVAPGEIYAFLGLNGAGKTTTIRMLLGMIKPNSGWPACCRRRCGSAAANPGPRSGTWSRSPTPTPN